MTLSESKFTRILERIAKACDMYVKVNKPFKEEEKEQRKDLNYHDIKWLAADIYQRIIVNTRLPVGETERKIVFKAKSMASIEYAENFFDEFKRWKKAKNGRK